MGFTHLQGIVSISTTDLELFRAESSYLTVVILGGYRSQGWPEGSLFNSYYRGVGRLLLWFPGLSHFTLETYLIMPSVMQGGIKNNFWVFGMTRPEIEPRSPGPLANTLLIRPMAQLCRKSHEFLCKKTTYTEVLKTKFCGMNWDL